MPHPKTPILIEDPKTLVPTDDDLTLLDGRVVLVRLPSVDDASGSLTPIETQRLGFHPVRSFLVRARPGAVRGGHGHRRGRQLLVRVSGEIEVTVSHGGEERTIVLGRDADAVLIAAPVWASQRYLGGDPCLLVYSDQPFDSGAYVHEKS